MTVFGDKIILTVSRLTSLLRGVLEENFEHVWVEGEMSNVALPASGHLYFTLKDSTAQLRCVMFRASARALKFKPGDGMGMIVRGRISVYDQRGEYQLIVEYLEPQGVGPLQLAFIQLKEKLAKEGLFAEAHKKAIPKLPQRIGVVTSPTGAAIHDILNVINRRFANLEILVYPVRVQGDGAGEEIAMAIHELNRYKEIDVMIVGRGGGFLEDLWAFNEESVARAIYQSRIPVISAIGHETDFTIADFTADMRAPTPSAAAEIVVKSKAELHAELDALSHRLDQVTRHRISTLCQKLSGLKRGLKDPSLRIGHMAQRLDDLKVRLDFSFEGGLVRRRDRFFSFRDRLKLKNPALQLEFAREQLIVVAGKGERAIQRIIDSCRENAAVTTARLEALSPLATLYRGFTIARTHPEKILVRESGQLATGDRLDLTFHKGSAVCVVESKSDKD